MLSMRVNPPRKNKNKKNPCDAVEQPSAPEQSAQPGRGDALKQERDEPEAEKAEGDAEKSRPCCGTLGKRAGHLGGHPASLSDGGRWRQSDGGSAESSSAGGSEGPQGRHP